MSRVKAQPRRLRHAVDPLVGRDSVESFFSDPAKVELLQSVIASWEGTPFHEYSKAKGRAGGVDCIRLIEAIYIECALTNRKFEFPHVPLDFTCHQDRSIILEFLRGEHDDPQAKIVARLFAENQQSEISNQKLVMPGDLLCFRVGKAVNHLGVALDNDQFAHCIRPVGVLISSLRDHTYGSRLETVFRPLAS